MEESKEELLKVAKTAGTPYILVSEGREDSQACEWLVFPGLSLHAWKFKEDGQASLLALTGRGGDHDEDESHYLDQCVSEDERDYYVSSPAQSGWAQLRMVLRFSLPKFPGKFQLSHI